VRRLHAPVGHTPDSAKIGIIRRVVIAALEAGAERVDVACDSGGIARRAIAKLDGAELIDGPDTGSALDTRRAAAQLSERGCCPIVVLGGDGTCRDAAIGGPQATLLAISTGTNNVFPRFIDGSSAGTAAGLLAAGRIAAQDAVSRAKRLVITIERADGTTDTDIALVDVAAIATTQTGSRAVLRAGVIIGVVAAIAHPTSTGLSSIAGRLHPLGREEPGAVHVRLADPALSARLLRAPIVPGQFEVVGIDSVEVLPEGGTVSFAGPLVLAYDGERERPVPADAVAHVRVERTGPRTVDVDRVLLLAAHHHLFDEPVDRPDAVTTATAHSGEAPHGH
jgi:hypothetical protein